MKNMSPPAAPAVDAYWLFHTTCRKNQTMHDWEPWTPTIYLLIHIVAQVLIMHKYVSQCKLVGLEDLKVPGSDTVQKDMQSENVSNERPVEASFFSWLSESIAEVAAKPPPRSL